MLSLNIPSYSKPSGYRLSELPTPKLSDPEDVIIRVHAASINPVDVKKADGIFKFALKDSLPYKIGYDCAGVVTEVGEEVTRCKVGDEVYVRLPESHRGSWSELVKCPQHYIALKPPSLSFEDAASVPLAAMTAFQALSKYEGGLAGKTVFIPAGLSGTGLFACQLAKHVFHAGKVTTTVSTSKISKVAELLGEGTVDEIIDYTKHDTKNVLQPGSVDFLFDTIGISMEYLSVMRPKTSYIVSVSTMPSGSQLQGSSVMRLPHHPVVPVHIRLTLNILDFIRKLRARRYGVNYSYMFLEPNGNDLDELARHIEEGNLKTVVGTTVKLRDIEEVRNACQVVYSGKGGFGKAVIKVG